MIKYTGGNQIFQFSDSNNMGLSSNFLHLHHKKSRKIVYHMITRIRFTTYLFVKPHKIYTKNDAHQNSIPHDMHIHSMKHICSSLSALFFRSNAFWTDT